MKPKMTIVGAGLVGCLWAILLRKKGFEVDVFEKRGDIRKQTAAGRSINLIITSRGLYGLEKAGLAKRAFELSVPVYGRMIHSKSGDMTYQAYGQDQEFNLSISRHELNKFLLDEAVKSGAQVFFDHVLDRVDFSEKKIQFSNGDKSVSHSYEYLFGTDGAGSLVRKNLLAAFPERFQENISWLEADYKELFLPLDKNSKPALDPRALHIWPRGSHMMMALANLDGSFTVTLYLPKKGTPSFETVKTSNEVTSLFENEFADAVSLMPSFNKDFLENPQGALGTVRCSRWTYANNVVLMGDAAHAIVPFFGQGMNCGFEDCTVLLKAFDEQQDWAKAIQYYDDVQRPNGNAIAEMALENWAEMRDKVGDAQFLLRKKVEGILEKNFPKLFKSRYGMVTYTLVPYALTQAAGLEQDRILQKLVSKISKPEELNLLEAETLLKSEYAPFLAQNRIELKRYQPQM